jgi:hypothetical protein
VCARAGDGVKRKIIQICSARLIPNKPRHLTPKPLGQFLLILARFVPYCRQGQRSQTRHSKNFSTLKGRAALPA